MSVNTGWSAVQLDPLVAHAYTVCVAPLFAVTSQLAERPVPPGDPP